MKDAYAEFTPHARMRAVRRNLPKGCKFHHVQSFPSVEDLTKVEVSESNQWVADYYEGKFERSAKWLNSWYGIGSKAELEECLYKGHPKRMKEIKKMADDIAHVIPKVKGTRRKVCRESQGDELDIHAMRRGDLQCWRRMRKIESPKARGRARAVKIYLRLTATGSVSADHMTKGASAGLALAQKLCAHGITVEIWAFAVSYKYQHSGREKNIFSEVCLKPRNTPFSLARLSFGAVAALDRYYFFRAMQSGIKVDSGMGYASGGHESPQWEADVCSRDKTVKTIIAPSIGDVASASAWVRTQLEGIL